MSDVAVLERPKRACPDCGVESAGEFCPQCGELMEPRVLRIHHYFTDILTEIFAFDTKVMRTIPALLFRPGQLAKEFVAGRRRRYLSPLRLHIIIGIGLFVAMGYASRTKLDGQLSKSESREQLDSAFQEINRVEAARGKVSSLPKSASEFKSITESVSRLATEIGPYILLLTATPLFALFLKIIYRKRKKLYVEHLIFSLYFFSFAFLILIPPLLWHPKILVGVSATLFTIYLYFGLRKFYDDRRFGLLFRLVSCMLACGFITILAFGLSLFAATEVGSMMGEVPSGYHGTQF